MIKLQVNDEYLEQLGFQDLNDEKKRQKMDTVMQSIHKRVAVRFTNDLNDDQMKEYLLVVQSDDLMEPWLKKNVPDYEDIVQEELIKFRDEYTKDRQDIESKLEDAIQKAEEKEG